MLLWDWDPSGPVGAVAAVSLPTLLPETF
jgi:hypothetical protein